ncbi:hypothetical protein SESBI_25482 [Sesbania bispinosa]|nr:hypothetical protein SESBI_25482 [Sesbania bispinosa]
MSRKVNFVGEIDRTKESWKLAVRVTNVWRSENYMDVIFMDEKGGKIHASLNESDLRKLNVVIEERNTYSIKNLEVKENTGKYKLCNHLYKVGFMKGTNVRQVDFPQIPLNVFQFTSFEDIIKGNASTDVLIDVIGEFIDIQQHIDESIPRKLVVVMKDQSGHTISWTLWEEYESQVFSFLGTHEGGPIIMLLSLALIKEAKVLALNKSVIMSLGNFPVTVQNTKVHSRLYINEDIDEINKFKSSLDSTHVYESYSQKLSQLSSSSHVTQGETFIQDANVMSLAKINETQEEIFCLTVGKIEMIYVSNGWQYDACVKCSKKLESETEPFICARCGKLNSERVPRFRLEVKVSDKNAHSKFILWDKHCVQLLNQSALDLKKQMIQEEGVFDPMELPGPIDSILGKVLAFKIKIQLKYKGYSVHQISEDPQIIESIIGSIKKNEGAGKIEKGKLVCSGVNEVDYMDSVDGVI